jgi:hypothetical protein
MTRRLRAPAIVRIGALLAIAAASVLGTVCSASAHGTILIQSNMGNTDTYENVNIQVIHNTLNITSEDGKGTLIITRAACAYQGQVYTCLPTGATLVQNGSVHALDLRGGTIYANMTDQSLTLPNSSTQLRPRGVLMSIHTGKGSYINMVGKIDKVVQ